MTPRERVQAVFRNEPVDRVPLNVFAGWNPGIREQVRRKYGSVDAFCDTFGIDIATGVLPRFPFGVPPSDGSRSLDDYLAMEPLDPIVDDVLNAGCDPELNLFETVRDALEAHDEGKAVFVHAWGVFELSQFLFEKNGMPGTTDALMNMIAEQEKSREMYLKLAEWSAECVGLAAKAGADVIELSDDWGQQNTMLFSPRHWADLIMPATKLIVDAARRYDVPVLLHSDGDITLVLDRLRDLGLSGLHPVQESAGMTFDGSKAILGNDFVIMGGLDTVTALPVMNADAVRDEVRRVFGILKPLGPFIFSGSHMLQDDAPLDVVEAAYETARELAPYDG